MSGTSFFVCPCCGESVPADARACPSCGSDERTGWSQNTYLDGIDLPGLDDDYDELRANEFSSKKFKADINWKTIIGTLLLFAVIFLLVLR
ncbi:MAG: zinc ribbon domain-containing protein [Chitinispirillales bacterium]|nr:zinc ribbon domain-containing protein [Chitinispirillales bacterium]